MIYADYNATALPTKDHLQEVFVKLQEASGNPSSPHLFGRKAKLALETARQKVADLFLCPSESIVFTSSATEANNLLINSHLQSRAGNPSNILTSVVEHPSILNPIKEGVRKKLCSVHFCNVDKECIINSEEIEELIQNKKIDLVCLIHVQNEIGSINNIQAISDKIKKISKDTHIHVDSVQALGKIDLKWLSSSSVDSASFSAHKIGGLQGIGCLYLKARHTLKPLIFGGGQELGSRAGTENLSGIISFGCISSFIQSESYKKSLHFIKYLKQNLLNELKPFSNIMLHGNPKKQADNTISLYIHNLNLQNLLISFERHKIAVSSKSACSSGIHSPSYTLKAMGLSDEIATNSIRISLGPSNTEDDIAIIAQLLIKESKSLK